MPVAAPIARVAKKQPAMRSEAAEAHASCSIFISSFYLTVRAANPESYAGDVRPDILPPVAPAATPSKAAVSAAPRCADTDVKAIQI